METGWSAFRPEGDAEHVTYERLWHRLLTVLAEQGAVHEVDRGLLITRADGSRVEVVMTRRDWDELVTIPFGDFSTAVRYLLGMVREARQPYLVYELYALEPSDTPELPPDTSDQEIAAYAREHPGAQFGWYATNPDGSRDYFRDFEDGP